MQTQGDMRIYLVVEIMQLQMEYIIRALLRPMQSIMMAEKLFMWNCMYMPVEVRFLKPSHRPSVMHAGDITMPL